MAFATAALTTAQVALGAISVASGIAGAATEAAAASHDAEVAAFNEEIRSENDARGFEAQAEADSLNAAILRQREENEKVKARADAEDFFRQGRAALAGSRAERAASGFALEGSPALVDEATFQAIEFGAQRIRFAGNVEGTRLGQQADILETTGSRSLESAGLARVVGKESAKNIRSAGRIGQVSAAVRGVGSAARGLSSIAAIKERQRRRTTTIAGGGVRFG